jgi:hypothetical protein
MVSVVEDLTDPSLSLPALGDCELSSSSICSIMRPKVLCFASAGVFATAPASLPLRLKRGELGGVTGATTTAPPGLCASIVS